MSEDGTFMSGTGTDVRLPPAELSDRMQETLARIADKWCMLIMDILSDGPMRYSELGRNIVNISQRMLTLSLRKLERDGLIVRTVTPTSPPQVEYALSELGQSLLAQLKPLVGWMLVHENDIRDSRVRYDRLGGAW
jgi:DNA-binding HxlR family transcriptional regulator